MEDVLLRTRQLINVFSYFYIHEANCTLSVAFDYGIIGCFSGTEI